MPGQGSNPYHVVSAGLFGIELGAALARAPDPAVADRLLADLQAAIEFLQEDPIGRGDPFKTHPAAGLREFHWLFRRISFRYGVDETRRIVYLTRLRPVFDHPLAGP